jgi:hypothetical protein
MGVVRVCDIAHRTSKRKRTLHNPNYSFSIYKIIKKIYKSNLLIFIFIILYFLKKDKVYKTRF